MAAPARETSARVQETSDDPSLPAAADVFIQPSPDDDMPATTF